MEGVKRFLGFIKGEKQLCGNTFHCGVACSAEQSTQECADCRLHKSLCISPVQRTCPDCNTSSNVECSKLYSVSQPVCKAMRDFTWACGHTLPRPCSEMDNRDTKQLCDTCRKESSAAPTARSQSSVTREGASQTRTIRTAASDQPPRPLAPAVQSATASMGAKEQDTLRQMANTSNGTSPSAQLKTNSPNGTSSSAHPKTNSPNGTSSNTETLATSGTPKANTKKASWSSVKPPSTAVTPKKGWDTPEVQEVQVEDDSSDVHPCRRERLSCRKGCPFAQFPRSACAAHLHFQFGFSNKKCTGCCNVHAFTRSKEVLFHPCEREGYPKKKCAGDKCPLRWVVRDWCSSKEREGCTGQSCPLLHDEDLFMDKRMDALAFVKRLLEQNEVGMFKRVETTFHRWDKQTLRMKVDARFKDVFRNSSDCDNRLHEIITIVMDWDRLPVSEAYYKEALVHFGDSEPCSSFEEFIQWCVREMNEHVGYLRSVYRDSAHISYFRCFEKFASLMTRQEMKSRDHKHPFLRASEIFNTKRFDPQSLVYPNSAKDLGTFLKLQYELLRADCFRSLSYFLNNKSADTPRGPAQRFNMMSIDYVGKEQACVNVRSAIAIDGDTFQVGNIVLLHDSTRLWVAWFTLLGKPRHNATTKTLSLDVRFEASEEVKDISQIGRTPDVMVVVHSVFFIAYGAPLLSLGAAIDRLKDPSSPKTWQHLGLISYTASDETPGGRIDTLDEHQASAYSAATGSRKIVLIQGPPGTGKTMVGSSVAMHHAAKLAGGVRGRADIEGDMQRLKQAIDAINACRGDSRMYIKAREQVQKKKRESLSTLRGPILVVTQKNQSLDKFLYQLKMSKEWEDLKLGDDALVRIGGQCAHQGLQVNTIHEARGRRRSPRFPSRVGMRESKAKENEVERLRTDGLGASKMWELISAYWGTHNLPVTLRDVQEHCNHHGRVKNVEYTLKENTVPEDSISNIDTMKSDAVLDRQYLPHPKIEYGWFPHERRPDQLKDVLEYCVSYRIQELTAEIFDQDHIGELQREWRVGSDCEILGNALVVAATITGSCIHLKLLEACRPTILIVEEAAEILEGHLLPCMLLPSLEKIILIGDDKQLEPICIEHTLQQQLGRSVFERLRLLNHPVEMLRVQRRMHPEFSVLIEQFYNQSLQDHPKTAEAPAWPIFPRLFFWTHSQPEIEDGGIWNAREVEAVVYLVHTLLARPDIPSEKITVLTNYKMQKHKLEQSLMALKLRVCVSTVDNFQGSENDFIIVSLVRTARVTEFLKNPRRYCVAMSRARRGMIVIGNMSLLSGIEHWENGFAYMSKGSVLPQSCPRHGPLAGIPIIRCKDLPEFPECVYPCGKVRECKHTCEIKCHEGPCEPCTVSVVARNEACGHQKTAPCHRWESAKCEQRLLYTCPKCTTKTVVLCYQYTTKMMPTCEGKVGLLLACGHTETVMCGDPRPECKHTCGKTLGCGHTCNEDCGKTCICREEVPKVKACGHTVLVKCYERAESVTCPKPCEKILPCGHLCSAMRCGDVHSCERTSYATLRCGHKVLHKCTEPPGQCTSVCGRRLPCGHECQMNCGVPCDANKCSVRVPVVLPCGHRNLVECGKKAAACVECVHERKSRVMAKIRDTPNKRSLDEFRDHKAWSKVSELLPQGTVLRSGMVTDGSSRAGYYSRLLQELEEGGNPSCGLWFKVKSQQKFTILSETPPLKETVEVIKALHKDVSRDEKKNVLKASDDFVMIKYRVDLSQSTRAVVSLDLKEVEMIARRSLTPNSSPMPLEQLVKSLLQDLRVKDGKMDCGKLLGHVREKINGQSVLRNELHFASIAILYEWFSDVSDAICDMLGKGVVHSRPVAEYIIHLLEAKDAAKNQIKKKVYKLCEEKDLPNYIQDTFVSWNLPTLCQTDRKIRGPSGTKWGTIVVESPPGIDLGQFVDGGDGQVLIDFPMKFHVDVKEEGKATTITLKPVKDRHEH